MKIISTAAALLLTSAASAFTVNRPAAQSLTAISKSTATALNVNLPRIDLPDLVTEKLVENNLKNPNAMDDEEYKAFSGAAILGTLALFIPSTFITGFGEVLGDTFGLALFDFAVSALIGGGAAIYFSLSDNEVGATVRGYGKQLGLPTFRVDLPPAVTDVMENDLGLINPNGMSEDDYNGYSGAALAGTLIFFLLPGALITGEFENFIGLVGSFVTTFLFAAILGGGGAIYLSLGGNELAGTVNSAGIKLLDTVDDVVDKISGSLAK